MPNSQPLCFNKFVQGFILPRLSISFAQFNFQRFYLLIHGNVLLTTGLTNMFFSLDDENLKQMAVRCEGHHPHSEALSVQLTHKEIVQYNILPLDLSNVVTYVIYYGICLLYSLAFVCIQAAYKLQLKPTLAQT